MSEPLSIGMLERIGDMAEAEWDALLAPDSSPFMEWAWLEALERTGCAAADRGWLPRHLTVHRGAKLIGVAPAYMKGNSEGEFVFDFQWAGLAERRLGLRYYPKLLLAVPFTPATGDRILVAPGEDPAVVRAAIAEGCKQLCDKMEISSAHLNFPREEEQQAFADRGFIKRNGIQFQWFNQGFQTFEDFLTTLPSKKRTQIRRERKEVRAQGITIETRSGAMLDDQTMDAAYRFYVSTVDKFSWGRRYLNDAFFKLMRDRWSKSGQLEIVVAREGSEMIAGAINIRKGDRLYGRYWGGEERKFLHFEVCYYHSIDEAIARKLAAFEPGAGGEHKHARGFQATLTRSVHHLRDPRMRRAIADFCAEESAYLHKVVAGEIQEDE